MNKRYTRTVLFDLFKGIIAMAFSSLIGWMLYFFIFRNTNGENPERAVLGTCIVSLGVFVLSIYVFLRMLPINSKDYYVIDERQALKDAFRDSGYDLDYKAYFKKMVKTRLWGYYLAAALWQIPTIVNYVIVAFQPGDLSIYEFPVPLYKWNVQSLFAYELLGKAWFLGVFLYMALFIAAFTFFTYLHYKEFLVRPSYLDKK